jgi:UTP--glucose-1-phosphate uridylyltransferase
VKIETAVVTAAGRGQRTLPLQKLVDRDGHTKTALAIIAAEVANAGIERLGVVVRPGDQAAYADALGAAAANVTFVEQEEPLGYGHAVYCARGFVGDAPFLHLVGDHLWIGAEPDGCARQLVRVASEQGTAVSAVQATREAMLPLYGAVGGRAVPGRDDLYEISRVFEKPTPTAAEQELIVPGLRAGHYLCFFGMHVLTPTVFGLLADEVSRARHRIDLSGALGRLAERERYLAFRSPGSRHNLGEKYGLLQAQLALALSGCDRDTVLTQMVELLVGALGRRPGGTLPD